MALAWLKTQDWRLARSEGRKGRMAESSVLVSQPPRARTGAAAGTRGHPHVERDARANAEIDRVLDKINASGVDSLTPAERKFLTEISRRMRTPPKS
jgi:hypothetical protein